jgi:uncharacterized protein (TIGR03437 family)
VIAPPTFDSSGNLLLLGAQGALLTLPPGYNFATPMIVGFANAASYTMNTGLYPGTLISLFGLDLPANVQVMVNGASVPLLYTGPTQVNFEVQPSFNTYNPVIIVLPGQPSVVLPVLSAQTVGIFTVDGTYAAALNQDGTANSASNPAAIGSIVSLFGTGSSSNGATVSINSAPVDVFYFGSAPGLAGVFQANIQVSAAGPIVLQTPGFLPGELTSNSVRVYTK